MAYPTTIIAAAGVGGFQPLIKSSTGNYYCIARVSNTVIDCYKATDPSSSFAVQDATGNPASFSVVNKLTYVQYGDTIRIATYDSTTNLYEYHEFNMADDTWTTTDEVIESVSATPPTFPWISIANRSDGDVIVVYAGLPDGIKGGDKERVDSNERTGVATWTGAVALDAAGDVHYGNPNIVKGTLTDDMHINWQTTADTADPPTAWTDVEARTLDSANSLSTLVTSTSDTAGAMLGLSNMVSYEDAGTQRIAWMGATPTVGESYRTTEDGSDDIQAPTVVEAMSATAQPKINGEVGVLSLAEDSGVLYCLYSNADDTDDIWYITSTDDGATWSTEAQELDAVACNYISCNILQIGADKVLAFLYDDGGTIKVNVKTLAALSYTQLDDAKFIAVNSHVGPFQV